MYRKQVRRRRAVLVGLIVLSLVLLSSHFSEAESGPLHTIQRGVSTVLSPVGDVAEGALKPVRDLFSWVDETFEAKGENEDLRAEVAELREQLAATQDLLGDSQAAERFQELDGTTALAEFKPVTARVVNRTPTSWEGAVGISQGSNAGVRVNDPVISPDGLVGRVRQVFPNGASVELITDPDNAVSAEVLPTAAVDEAVETALVSENPTGLVGPVAGDPEQLLLDFVDDAEEITEGQILITAGWSNGTVSSAYPAGIPIGRISVAETENDSEFQRIEVEPFADLRNVEHVQVLTGGAERPGVPG